ncbi:MAG: hypothetical protein AAGG68_01475 [Bacteroidota bacterium]
MKLPYKVLHDKAMEFVDEAQLAKMEGNEEAAQGFFNKAFLLEREPALSAPNGQNSNFAKLLYTRSAAYLAFKLGNTLEALHLSNLGLNNNTPVFIEKQLKSLKNKIKSKPNVLNFTGLFTQANAKENSILVEDETSNQVYSIQVASQQIQEIVKNYWSTKVAVEAKITNQGIVMLEKVAPVA